MTSETDAEFLRRLGNAGAAHEEDFNRLFALARRGAAVQQPCHETCEPSRGQHHINCPNIAKAYADRIEQLEAEVKVWQGHAKTAIWSDSEECKFLTARIEQLEAALREIADYRKHGWVIGLTDVARAALEGRT